jgi:hypothetical protein
MGQHRPTHFGDVFPGSQARVRACIVMLEPHFFWILASRTPSKNYLSLLRVLMYASELMVAPLGITSTRMTASQSQKTVNMTFPAEGAVLNFFFLAIEDDVTPLAALLSPAQNGVPRFRHL